VKTRRWEETAHLLGLSYPRDGGEAIELTGGLAQRWGDRDAREIDGHDIYAVIEEARRVGVPGIAARTDKASETRARSLYAALSGAFGWMQRHRIVTVNPCTGVFKPPPPRPRDRVLTGEELRRFWQATSVVARPFGDVLKLLPLTGCRLYEIAALRWDEVVEDGAAISIPGSRTKNHRPHVVPLSETARTIIAQVPRVAGCGFVFTTDGRSHVSGWSKTKARLDAEMGIAPWRIHDLRRTACTGMGELGVAPHVIELVVNHVSGVRAGVAGIYNRSELMAERRAALERWAAHVAGIVEGRPVNVVPIRGGGR
jgi:integrase